MRGESRPRGRYTSITLGPGAATMVVERCTGSLRMRDLSDDRPQYEAPAPFPVLYFSGLDLGLAAEFTALAVLERTRVPDPTDPERTVGHYAVRHLQRFPLGTSYTA